MLCTSVDEAYFVVQLDGWATPLDILGKPDNVKLDLLELVLRSLVVDTIYLGFEELCILPDLILTVPDELIVLFVPVSDFVPLLAVLEFA